jgi:hypothetical protein
MKLYAGQIHFLFIVDLTKAFMAGQQRGNESGDDVPDEEKKERDEIKQVLSSFDFILFSLFFSLSEGHQ